MERSWNGKGDYYKVPLAEMFGYATDLRCLWQGRANIYGICSLWKVPKKCWGKNSRRTRNEITAFFEEYNEKLCSTGTELFEYISLTPYGVYEILSYETRGQKFSTGLLLFADKLTAFAIWFRLKPIVKDFNTVEVRATSLSSAGVELLEEYLDRCAHQKTE